MLLGNLVERELEKAKKTKVATTNPSQCSQCPQRPQRTPAPVESSDEEEADNADSDEDDEACFKCGYHDPPSDLGGAVEWYQCDNTSCERWFHDVCLDHYKKKGILCYLIHN